MAPIDEQGAVWSYHPPSDAWSQLTTSETTLPYPQARSYHCAASDGQTSFFVHAGCPADGRLPDLWAFDIANRLWLQLPDAPGPPRGGASMAYSEGKLYRMHGFDGRTEQGGSIDVFDIGARTWSSKAFNADGLVGPQPRSVCTLLPLTLQGRKKLITLFGERDPSSLGHAGAGKMLADVWLYDIAANWWTKIMTSGEEESPVSRGWFAADVHMGADGKPCVVIHGGLDENNERLGEMWRLSF